MATVNQALEQLDTSHGKITDQEATLEADIHRTIGQLQETLNVRKTELIGQLHRITQDKLKILAAQKDQLETTQAQLGSCLSFMKRSMESQSHGNVLNMKTSVAKQVKELTTPLQFNLLNSCVEADLQYFGSPDILTDCQIFGQLSGPIFPDPSKCHATGSGLEVASVEEKSTAILHAVNFKGEPCSQPISSSECELISEITGTTILGKVERIEQSKYEISYQPTIKGRHNLLFKVDGQHIRGSPFSVAVKSSIRNLGTPIHCINEVNGPYGVALDHKCQLVVSGFHDHCIHVFSPDGKKLLSFGSRGSGQGQFLHPMGVAVDKDGNILVVDSENNRVQKFTSEGQFLTSKEDLQLNGPSDVAFNTSNNKVYVTDTNNHRIQILNSDLTFSGSFVRGKGKFEYPQRVACDSTGKVYVTSFNSHSVQVFTAKGKLLKAFSNSVWGELRALFGLAVQGGMVYVASNESHRVAVFTLDGQLVKAFGGHGRGPGEFQCPRGLAVDDTGVVYVCDMNNNSIKMY